MGCSGSAGTQPVPPRLTIEQRRARCVAQCGEARGVLDSAHVEDDTFRVAKNRLHPTPLFLPSCLLRFQLPPRLLQAMPLRLHARQQLACAAHNTQVAASRVAVATLPDHTAGLPLARSPINELRFRDPALKLVIEASRLRGSCRKGVLAAADTPAAAGAVTLTQLTVSPCTAVGPELAASRGSVVVTSAAVVGEVPASCAGDTQDKNVSQGEEASCPYQASAPTPPATITTLRSSCGRWVERQAARRPHWPKCSPAPGLPRVASPASLRCAGQRRRRRNLPRRPKLTPPGLFGASPTRGLPLAQLQLLATLCRTRYALRPLTGSLPEE